MRQSVRMTHSCRAEGGHLSRCVLGMLWAVSGESPDGLGDEGVELRSRLILGLCLSISLSVA